MAHQQPLAHQLEQLRDAPPAPPAAPQPKTLAGTSLRPGSPGDLTAPACPDVPCHFTKLGGAGLTLAGTSLRPGATQAAPPAHGGEQSARRHFSSSSEDHLRGSSCCVGAADQAEGADQDDAAAGAVDQAPPRPGPALQEGAKGRLVSCRRAPPAPLPPLPLRKMARASAVQQRAACCGLTHRPPALPAGGGGPQAAHGCQLHLPGRPGLPGLMRGSWAAGPLGRAWLVRPSADECVVPRGPAACLDAPDAAALGIGSLLVPQKHAAVSVHVNLCESHSPGRWHQWVASSVVDHRRGQDSSG
jgi:hypothetical protein